VGSSLLGERGKGREGLWGERLCVSSSHYAGVKNGTLRHVKKH
jgi:hypothetical protein